MRPVIVCLCGSTRFSEAFREANLRETLRGRIVLSIGVDTKSDRDLFEEGLIEDWETAKAMLDELHKRKIDLADEVLVLNVGGYIGASTRSEIGHALLRGKKLRFLEGPICNRCYALLRPGQAIDHPSFVGTADAQFVSGEGFVVAGPARLVQCLKCPECGASSLFSATPAITEFGERIPPMPDDPPCSEYDPSGAGAGLEIDGHPQCANCGHPRSLHPQSKTL